MLRTGARDASGVSLLKGVIADQMCRDLAGQTDNRDRIHQRIGQAGDGIGRPGPRCDKHHAGLAGRAGIALGSVNRRLLVTHQDVLDLVVLEERIIDRQHGATGVAEHNLDALILERLQQYLGARHHLCLLRGVLGLLAGRWCGFWHCPNSLSCGYQSCFVAT